jgi:hypothetical protein
VGPHAHAVATLAVPAASLAGKRVVRRAVGRRLFDAVCVASRHVVLRQQCICGLCGHASEPSEREEVVVGSLRDGGLGVDLLLGDLEDDDALRQAFVQPLCVKRNCRRDGNNI